MAEIHSHTPPVLRAIEKRSPEFVLLVAIALTIALGFVDVATGWEMSFSIFYLIPVTLVSWRIGRRGAIAMALFCALAWFSADRLAGHPYSEPWIPFWNGSVRLGLFLAVGVTLAALADALHQVNRLARVDALTGVANARAFEEHLLYHLRLSARHADPLTLAAIDLDHFKAVNDRFGHGAGDHALRTVAGIMLRRLRSVDIVARVGGDEFVALLPRTDEGAAAGVLEQIRATIEEEMTALGWPVTVSVGVATARGMPERAGLREAADRALYRAKAEGRNRVRTAEDGAEGRESGSDVAHA